MKYPEQARTRGDQGQAPTRQWKYQSRRHNADNPLESSGFGETSLLPSLLSPRFHCHTRSRSFNDSLLLLPWRP